MTNNTRLPAEWEDQDGVLLAWPHENSDWREHLDLVEPVFVAIVKAITRFEKVIIAAHDREAVSALLELAGIEPEKVRLFHVPTNDTWARDFGPITVFESNRPILLNYGFNGWGLKFAADLDNLVTEHLFAAGAFRAPVITTGLILEGGSIESDGAGTILTTAECLLSRNRNPHMNREEVERALRSQLGADRMLWLEHGFLAGDDTDSHVDTLARFCPNNTILHVSCNDPADEHHIEISEMVEQLKRFRTREGATYRLIPLPWPNPCYDREGNRLPATYANFLIINHAVLVPTYRDRSDEAALEAVALAFPDREIIGIDCLPLILQHGSLHCVTMQLPKGVMT